MPKESEDDIYIICKYRHPSVFPSPHQTIFFRRSGWECLEGRGPSSTSLANSHLQTQYPRNPCSSFRSHTLNLRICSEIRGYRLTPFWVSVAMEGISRKPIALRERDGVCSTRHKVQLLIDNLYVYTYCAIWREWESGSKNISRLQKPSQILTVPLNSTDGFQIRIPYTKVSFIATHLAAAGIGWSPGFSAPGQVSFDPRPPETQCRSANKTI